jgi:hypothetical protein
MNMEDKRKQQAANSVYQLLLCGQILNEDTKYRRVTLIQGKAFSQQLDFAFEPTLTLAWQGLRQVWGFLSCFLFSEVCFLIYKRG